MRLLALVLLLVSAQDRHDPIVKQRRSLKLTNPGDAAIRAHRAEIGGAAAAR